jgi:hypothetical protein
VGPEEAAGAFQFEGQQYSVTARWPAPGETTAVGRLGNPNEGDQHMACLLTIRRSDGFTRSARLTIFGLALSSLERAVTADRVLEFYVRALPSLMRVSPAATPSWPGLLATPEQEWFHHGFGINDIDALRSANLR